MNYPRAAIAILLTAGLAVTGASLAPAWAVPNYPSAEEVAAAKKDVRTKKEMITRLEKLIEEQEIEAEALAAEAQIKGEKYNQAKAEVDEMTKRVNRLEKQVESASLEAETAQTQLGQLAAQMYRNGTAGTSLNLFLNAGAADDLLYQLGAQEKVAQQSDVIYQRSIAKQREAQALTAELTGARAELKAKAKIAKSTYQEAKAAADALQSKVDENTQRNRTMYSQLANLRNTASDLERQRAEGLAAERRQAAVSTMPIAPELYNVGAPDFDKVEVAISFAKQQLGERYVLGGAGPDIWDCSGITLKSYAAAGVYIGWHSATAQFNVLAAQRKLVPLTQWQPGDLIWWTQSRAFNGDKYHVAIYLGDGLMLEAPNPARTVRIVPVRYGELFPYAGRPTARG